MSNAPLQEQVEAAATRFEAAGIESALVDAELLACHLLDCSRGELQSKMILGETMDAVALSSFETLVGRRAAREPLQHITGKAYFRSLELRVGLGVFVPRPETEGVAQLAIDALRLTATEEPIAVDLGTGSGAIALAMATEVSNAKIYAVEKSPEAMVFTSENFARYGSENATLIQGDLADAFQELNGKASVVVSNPPYIPDRMIPRDLEVRNFDPELALYGGDDGMDVIHLVSDSARRLLHSGGTLIIEHAEIQSQQVCQLLLASGWRQIRAHKDLTMRDRAVSAIK
jgi:release factor glutamine methyltransferase